MYTEEGEPDEHWDIVTTNSSFPTSNEILIPLRNTNLESMSMQLSATKVKY